MSIRATQPIASAFGTYRPGDLIDEAAAPVLDAWLAAGIVADEPAEPDEPKGPDEADLSAGQADVEMTTSPEPETAVGRRLRTGPAPQRRFEAKPPA
jgi:hypothetical protein